MKRVLIFIIAVMSFSVMGSCQEKLMTYELLPASAQKFIDKYFPTDEILVAVTDDDLVRPDFEVSLASGVHLEFDYKGNLKKVTSRTGLPENLIPEGIRNYVSARYPDAGYLEYEIERKTYEVKLTNRLELKFNSDFNVVEVDD